MTSHWEDTNPSLSAGGFEPAFFDLKKKKVSKTEDSNRSLPAGRI